MGSVEQMFAVNVGGVKNVVDSALALGIDRIVCVSSITAIFNTDAAKVTPDAAPAKSKLPYGQSKVEAEIYLRRVAGTGAPIAIVYPGGIIGPDDPGFSDSFKALKHRMENGFRIFGDGGMQFIDVRDLAALICSLVIAVVLDVFCCPVFTVSGRSRPISSRPSPVASCSASPPRVGSCA